MTAGRVPPHQPTPDWIKDAIASHGLPLDRVLSWAGYDAPTFADSRRVILDVEVVEDQIGRLRRHVNLVIDVPTEPRADLPGGSA